MKKVISLLTNNFKHDNRVLKECTTLSKAGYNVTVVALHAEGLTEKETLENNIKVHRIPLKSRHWSKNRIIQLFKYAEYFYRLVKDHRKADIIHCNDIEPLPLAVMMKWFFNRKMKIVYDAHELEFDKKEKGSGYYPQNILAFAEKVLIKNTNAMITVTPLIAEAYSKEYNIAPPKLVMNCPTYKKPVLSKDIFRKKFNIRADQKIYLYQGGLLPKRGIEEILGAFEQLDNKFVVVFLGFGTLVDLVKKAASENENIFFHEAVSQAELPDFTGSADFGFCLLQGSTRNHQYALGNKIFEYIQARLPILCSNMPGFKQIMENNMGIVIQDHNNIIAIKNAAKEILNLEKEKHIEALEVAAKKYNWENQEKTLLDIYEGLYEK